MAEKNRISGVVDRIEGGMVVVVIRAPDDPDSTREIYVPRSKFKQVELQEGDHVSVLI
ncbi:MAG: hypothetical protein HQM09_10725 [Candidatus Riflebacteria bacterium]|nr:hypothetical protein [Candidatus Riflebacteria bacterium]